MNDLLHLVFSNPLYLGAAAALGVMFVFSLIKKLIKMAIVAVIMVSAGAWWLYAQGKPLPTQADAQRVLKQVEAGAKEAEAKAVELKKEAERAAKKADELKGKAEEAKDKAAEVKDKAQDAAASAQKAASK